MYNKRKSSADILATLVSFPLLVYIKVKLKGYWYVSSQRFSKAAKIIIINENNWLDVTIITFGKEALFNYETVRKHCLLCNAVLIKFFRFLKKNYYNC